MATGPEHYREAERHARYAADARENAEDARWHQAQAQVYATLALAAAQIEDMDNDVLRPGWAEIVDGT